MDHRPSEMFGLNSSARHTAKRQRKGLELAGGLEMLTERNNNMLHD